MIDPNLPMNRLQWETVVEKVYLLEVISIEIPDKKEVAGLVHRISIDFDEDGRELICIFMINWQRYETTLSHFLKNAIIHGNRKGGN